MRDLSQLLSAGRHVRAADQSLLARVGTDGRPHEYTWVESMVVHGSRSPVPRIGVSWIKSEEVATHYLLGAVRAAGGAPVPLLAGAASWATDIATLDGLVLSGGNAVDPRRYGEENRGLCRVVIPHRDELEAEAMHFCMERSLPVLGICRGMQLLNVEMGGSMLQNLTITFVEHESYGDASRFHSIDVLPSTKLASIVGASRGSRVNSRHHQGVAVKQLAPSLRLSAIAADGVVEGLEGTTEQFLLGIQFHPEYPGEVPEMVPIFDEMVARARMA